MGVQLLIRDQKFFNEFKNDVGFVSNLSDFTTNLTGSVMENIKVVMLLDIEWKSVSSDSDRFDVDATALTITRTGSGSWLDEGFSVGDTFNLINTFSVTPVFIFKGQIGSISDSIIVFTTISGTPLTTTTGYGDAAVRGLTPLTASIYKFGLLENNESFNIQSKVSLNDQGYYGGNIGFDTGGGVRDTNFVTLQRLGQYEDWRTGSVKVRYVSDPSFYVQRFEIEHEFTIVPYYVDGDISNLQNNIIPNLLDGLNSLKYSFNPGLLTVLTNPNSEKKVVFDDSLGSVAWYNERFNGFQNDYQVNSIAYEEQLTTNVADGLLIGSKTKVTVVVQSNIGNFSAGERAGVYVSYLPSQTEYTNTVLTDLKENFLYDSAINNGGLGSVAGQDFITNFEITNIVTNTMTLTFDVDYSIAQKIRLAGLNSAGSIFFVIGVQLGDVTLPSGNSNRVIIKADVQEYDASADIPDLWSFPKFDIYTHEKQIGVDTGTTDVTAWNEDGIVVDYKMRLDLNKDALLNSMSFMLVAYDPITKIYFELNRYSFNMFPATVSSGIQQLILNTDRGYILKTGDQFNDVILSVGANVAGLQDYDGRIGQKFSWQDWIQNLNVDTVFFDSNEPFNNLNTKTSNYSLLNGYEIRLAFFGNLFGTSTLGTQGLTNYLVLSPTLTVYDYEEDGGSDVWSHVIETFDETGTTNLGLSILTGQNTLFRSTWTNSGGPVSSLVGLWGINRIEKTNQLGYAIGEMSSINDPSLGELLIPTGVLTLLDMQIVGGNVVMECLIDGSVAQSNVDYNLSTRIQDDNVLIAGKEKAESTSRKEKGETTDIKLTSP
jgi:hypothetical protein